jgi:predicted DNA-binding transcriptional regulator AlpA
MRRILRVSELFEAGIVNNHMTLKRWIEDPAIAFPPGFMLGPNTRAWYEDEIEAWMAARPVEHPHKAMRKEQAKGRKPLGKGNGRKKRAQSEASASA